MVTNLPIRIIKLANSWAPEGCEINGTAPRGRSLIANTPNIFGSELPGACPLSEEVALLVSTADFLRRLANGILLSIPFIMKMIFNSIFII